MRLKYLFFIAFYNLFIINYLWTQSSTPLSTFLHLSGSVPNVTVDGIIPDEVSIYAKENNKIFNGGGYKLDYQVTLPNYNRLSNNDWLMRVRPLENPVRVYFFLAAKINGEWLHYNTGVSVVIYNTDIKNIVLGPIDIKTIILSGKLDVSINSVIFKQIRIGIHDYSDTFSLDKDYSPDTQGKWSIRIPTFTSPQKLKFSITVFYNQAMAAKSDDFIGEVNRIVYQNNISDIDFKVNFKLLFLEGTTGDIFINGTICKELPDIEVLNDNNMHIVPNGYQSYGAEKNFCIGFNIENELLKHTKYFKFIISIPFLGYTHFLAVYPEKTVINTGVSVSNINLGNITVDTREVFGSVLNTDLEMIAVLRKKITSEELINNKWYGKYLSMYFTKDTSFRTIIEKNNPDSLYFLINPKNDEYYITNEPLDINSPVILDLSKMLKLQ